MMSGQAELSSVGYQVSYNTHANWHMADYHFHEYYEINLALSDSVSFFVAGQVYQAERGTLFAFNDMDLHRSVSPPGAFHERYVLYFAPQLATELSSKETNLLECFVNRRVGAVHSVSLSATQLDKLIALLQRAGQEVSGIGFGADLRRRIVLTEILLLVNQAFALSTAVQPARLQPELQRVRPVLHFIEQHLAENLSLSRLSEEFYLNKYYLGQLFKRATGFTINEYIIHRRVLRARQLLQRRLSVQQAGQAVGFRNNSHFIRTFKKLVGTSPKQYQLGTYPIERRD